MRVYIPSPLRSYTAHRELVEAEGGTLEDLMLDLDRRYPGFRFRIIDEQDQIRPHIKVFVNGGQVRTLDRRLDAGDEVQILQALSGG